MKTTLVGMCRGDGKGYIKVRLESSCRPCSLGALLRNESSTLLPATVIPLDGWGENGGNWVCSVVLVFPLLDIELYQFEVVAQSQGASVASGIIRVSSNRLMWSSKASYAFRKRLTSQIRDIDKRVSPRVRLTVSRCMVAEQGIVIRFIEEKELADASEYSIVVFDHSGTSIESDTLLINRTVSHSKYGNRFSRIISEYSTRVPLGSSRVCIAVFDAKTGVGVDFLSLDSGMLSAQIRSTETQMMDASKDPDYDLWFRTAACATSGELSAQRDFSFDYRPIISIVVPLFRTPIRYFDAMVGSVLSQSYARWQLVLVNADPGNRELDYAIGKIDDNRVSVVSLASNEGIVGNTNAGIRACEGDYIGFLDHDDLLAPNALFEYVFALNQDPSIGLLYCDEDLIDEGGIHHCPHFKSDLNIDLLYSHNCITHFLMVKAELLSRVGMSPEYVSGAQDYDLVLRVLEITRNFKHIPKVLYHWRMHSRSTSMCGDSKPYAHEAGKRALQDHFDRCNIAVEVEDDKHPFRYKQVYLLAEEPSVSIVIPTKDHTDLLDACIQSIVEKVEYDNYEILLIENNSTDERTFQYYDTLKDNSRIRIVFYDGEFNYSKIINFGVDHSSASHLLLLNNDTRLITPGALKEMSGVTARKEVGVVGAKLLYDDGLTQHGGVVLGPGGVPAHLSHLLPDEADGYIGRAQMAQDLCAVTGACQFMRREVFDAVNGYREDFTVGYNDVDFCLKVRESGFLVVYLPSVKFFHNEFSSRGKDATTEKVIRGEREKGLLYYYWAHYFIKGDPYSNINLNKNSVYFQLDKSMLP